MEQSDIACFISSVAIGDRLFLSDEFNHRILVFDPSGKQVFCFGQQGGDPGSFNYPMGLLLHRNQLYVCDSWNHRIQVFDTSGNFLFCFGQLGNGPEDLHTPQDIQLGPNGLWIADSGNQRLKVYDPDGTFRHAHGGKHYSLQAMRDEAWNHFLNGENRGGEPRFSYPRRLLFCGNQLLVCDSEYMHLMNDQSMKNSLQTFRLPGILEPIHAFPNGALLFNHHEQKLIEIHKGKMRVLGALTRPQQTLWYHEQKLIGFDGEQFHDLTQEYHEFKNAVAVTETTTLPHHFNAFSCPKHSNGEALRDRFKTRLQTLFTTVSSDEHVYVSHPPHVLAFMHPPTQACGSCPTFFALELRAHFEALDEALLELSAHLQVVAREKSADQATAFYHFALEQALNCERTLAEAVANVMEDQPWVLRAEVLDFVCSRVCFVLASGLDKIVDLLAPELAKTLPRNMPSDFSPFLLGQLLGAKALPQAIADLFASNTSRTQALVSAARFLNPIVVYSEIALGKMNLEDSYRNQKITLQLHTRYATLFYSQEQWHRLKAPTGQASDLAMLYFKSGLLKQVNQLARCLEKAPETPLYKGHPFPFIYYVETHQFQAALDWLETYPDHERRNLKHHSFLLQTALGNTEKALATIEAEPQDPQFHHRKASVFLVSGLYEKARATLLQGSLVSPTPNLFNLLGMISIVCGATEDARVIYTQKTELSPPDRDLFVGLTYRAEHKFDAADEHFLKHPTHPYCNYHAAISARLQGDFTRAESFLNQEEEHNPTWLIELQRAITALARNDEGTFKAALDKLPSYAHVYWDTWVLPKTNPRFEEVVRHLADLETTPGNKQEMAWYQLTMLRMLI